MKLLFDATTLSHMNDKNGHRAGVFFVAYNLLKEFENAGVKITLYCEFSRYYYLKNISEFASFEIVYDKNLITDLIAKTTYALRHSPLKIQYGMRTFARIYHKYLYQPKQQNIDNLNKYELYFSPYDAPTKEIEQTTLLKFRMIHDIIPLLEDNLTVKNKAWWQWHYRIYNTINDKDFYLTNSEYTRRDVLKYFPFIKTENIKTTLLGVNEYFKKNKNITRQKYVFSLCTLGKRKNLIFAIKNFFEFIKRNNINDLKFVLAGGVWKKFEKELQIAIEEFDTSKLEFLGYVPDEQLPELYSNAMMFIYPSLYEGFGLPVLEAMKCGCPVITSNTTSLPEVIGEAGIKIDPNNNEELIRALEKMYYDRFFRELCIERGLIRSKNFTWKKCANGILSFIDEKQKIFRS